MVLLFMRNDPAKMYRRGERSVVEGVLPGTKSVSELMSAKLRRPASRSIEVAFGAH
jgi:hypothetical protein